jgi:hypothetical protein
MVSVRRQPEHRPAVLGALTGLALVAAVAAAAAPPPAVAAAADPSFLANWMGNMGPVIANQTVLDLSLPGSHDTMTYDLSTAMSDGYEGLPSIVTTILHALTPLVAGEFIRDQGRTQAMNITEQLEGGVRFIDFRIMLTSAPALEVEAEAEAGKDWYCLHGCQTNHPAKEYLLQVRKWLDDHPKEVVVFWLSRHGDTGLVGTKQYPATTVAQRRAFWSLIEQIFEGKLVDSSHGTLNEVTMAEHWSVGSQVRKPRLLGTVFVLKTINLPRQARDIHRERLENEAVFRSQVVIYATDYVEFTGNSSKAIDAKTQLDNQLGGSSITDIPKGVVGAVGCFNTGTRARDKAANRFYLVSMANSGPGGQVSAAAEYKYLPIGRDKDEEDCMRRRPFPHFLYLTPPIILPGQARDRHSLGKALKEQERFLIYNSP